MYRHIAYVVIFITQAIYDNYIKGINGMHELQAPRVVTLRQIWGDYLITRKLKPKTRDNYRQRLEGHLRDWLDVPASSITKDMVEQRHRDITSNKGTTIANDVMRTLRSLLTYASYKYESAAGDPLTKINPVKRLSELRAWNKEKRRTRVVQPTQIRAWFQAVYALNNATVRDMLIFILLTGARSCEATSLKWEDVDLETGIVKFRETKNGEDAELPISDYVRNLLAIRKLGETSRFVFPGRNERHPLCTQFKVYKAVCERSGVRFTLHDLRRTFMTMGDDLDIKNEVIKALVNHKPSDVTEGYIIRSTERLRRATQRITDAFLLHAGLRRVNTNTTPGAQR
jgi:integrase